MAVVDKDQNLERHKISQEKTVFATLLDKVTE